MKNLVLLFLSVFIASSSLGSEMRKAIFASNLDADSANATACITKGLNGSMWGMSTIPGPTTIETDGSDTEVVAVTASSAPLKDLAVGDSILVSRPDGTTDFRVIDVKTDDDTVTVNEAVNWTGGFHFRYLKLTCGETVNNGWLDVSDIADLTLVSEWNQGDLTSLDVRLECKNEISGGNVPITVYPGESSDCGAGATLVAGPYCNLLTAAVGQAARLVVVVYEPYDACRILLEVNTDASDATTDREQLTMYATGRVRD